jgi:hypothetical protein
MGGRAARPYPFFSPAAYRSFYEPHIIHQNLSNCLLEDTMFNKITVATVVATLVLCACAEDTVRVAIDTDLTDTDTADEDATIDDAVTDEVSDIASDEILADDPATDEDVIIADEDSEVADEILTDDPATDETGDEDAVVADCQTEGEVRWMSCGLNGNGTLKQKCSSGSWVDDGLCGDPDGCADGASEEQPCGLNGNGLQTRSCELGESWQWSSWTVCDDPDECKNGEPAKSGVCGYNSRGQYPAECVDGKIVNISTECDDPDECTIDEEDALGRICVDCLQGARWRFPGESC